MLKLRAVCVVIQLVVVPSAAFAQASITGIVRDTSGAVLPGVTVEASSPILIEKVRTAVADATGQYRIVNLRAGTYTVTFTLTGFSTVRREGIELTGAFVATVNADMSVGTLEETVTVTGESPIVDVQSVRLQTTMSNDTISALPSSRAYNSLMGLMPNAVAAGGAASDAQTVPGMVVFGGAGGRGNEGRLQLDGLSVGSAFNGAGVSAYIPDVGNAQEITMVASGGLGEAEVGGPTMNIVPKEGGNTIAGQFYTALVSEGMVGSNYSQELKDRGLTTPGELEQLWDFNLGIGGPIMRDRLWFFAGVRDEGSHRSVPGMFANANAGDPTKWTYVADTSRPAVNAASYRNLSLRLTVQATPRNKFNVFWDEQAPCEGGATPDVSPDVSACRRSGDGEYFAGGTAAPTPRASATLAPETAAYRAFGQRVRQVKWTSPVTSQLLLEGSGGAYWSRYGGMPMPGSKTTDLIRVVEQCATGCLANGNIPGLTYRSGNWSSNINMSVNWAAAATYVLGAQSMKFGYQGALLYQQSNNLTNSEYLQYRTNNGVPDQMTLTIGNFSFGGRVRADSFYAQDQWTRGRLTLQGALRYDHAWSYFPEVQVGPVRFFPDPVVYPLTTGVEGYHDLTPRGGIAFDVFGNGKTAIKGNVGRYLEAAQNGGLFIDSRPVGRLVTTTTRAWTDTDKDFVADCDLLNPGAQDLRSRGGDVCGANANQAFGTPVFDTTQDPALLSGWGIRSGDWQVGLAIEQELLPRVSLEVGYQRRWLVNFYASDSLNRSVADHTQFGINVPVDARLPGGGGNVLGGLYNVTAAAAALGANNFVTKAGTYGDQTQVANSINMRVTARPGRGLSLQAGFGTSNTNSDYCEIRSQLPEWTVANAQNPVNPWCNTSTGFRTRFTGFGSYTIPRIDVQVAGTMRSDPGGDLDANWAAPNSATVGLNRPFAGVGGQTVTVNLIEPGTFFGDRVNQIDIRVAKILRFGRTRTNVGVDITNITNAAPVLTYNETFIPGQAGWLTPTSVLQSRFIKFGVQVDF
ncbi:MAG TPA: TonB-dependent receptor [Vicinamibacterales bacterium]|nr:TonB-dependent receptor [Vicinamibacterales bacterium]